MAGAHRSALDSGYVRSELPGEPTKEAASRTELRRKHTDPRAAADLVFLVQQIDDVESRGEGSTGAKVKLMAHAQVNLSVTWRMVPVGDGCSVRKDEIVTQPRTEDHVRAEASSEQ